MRDCSFDRGTSSFSAADSRSGGGGPRAEIKSDKSTPRVSATEVKSGGCPTPGRGGLGGGPPVIPVALT